MLNTLFLGRQLILLINIFLQLMQYKMLKSKIFEKGPIIFGIVNTDTILVFCNRNSKNSKDQQIFFKNHQGIKDFSVLRTLAENLRLPDVPQINNLTTLSDGCNSVATVPHMTGSLYNFSRNFFLAE